MKKLIAWPTSWACFWIGHFFSKICCSDLIGNRGPQWLHDIFFYPYQWFMAASSDIQDWADLESGPWENPGHILLDRIGLIRTSGMNKFTDLYYELDGVVIDVEQGDGFDDVCLETVKRVKKELADLAESCTTALTDEQIIEIRDQYIPSQGERFDCLAFAHAVIAALSAQPKSDNGYVEVSQDLEAVKRMQRACAGIAGYQYHHEDDAVIENVNSALRNTKDEILKLNPSDFVGGNTDRSLKADAARYRWLRSVARMTPDQQEAVSDNTNIYLSCGFLEGRPTFEQFDAAIDAAIAATKEQQP